MTSRLGRSPLEFTAGPLGGGAGGSIRLSVDPARWVGQPLLTASYFDRLDSLLTALLAHPALGLEGEAEGNRLFSVRAEMPGVAGLARLVDFLGAVGKARQVARHFGLSPTCDLDTLGGKAVRDIRVAHALLTAGRYEFPSPDMRVDVTLDKSAARQFLEDRTIHDVVLYADEGSRLPFMGHEVDLGRLGWELSEAALYTPADELRRRLARPGDAVTVSFRTTRRTRRVLRAVTEDEWAEYRDGLRS